MNWKNIEGLVRDGDLNNYIWLILTNVNAIMLKKIYTFPVSGTRGGRPLTTESFYTEVMKITDFALAHQMADLTQQIHLSKKEMLIREGEQQEHFVFLLEGVLRGFFLDINGREITDCIAFQCGTPAMSTVILQEPSVISIEAVTPCELLAIEAQALQRLLQQNTELVWIYNAYLQQALQTHWQIKTMVCQHTAMERYQWFLQAYPGLIDQMNNKHIASFLGMTPVTLSRLRRTLRENDHKQ